MRRMWGPSLSPWLRLQGKVVLNFDSVTIYYSMTEFSTNWPILFLNRQWIWKPPRTMSNYRLFLQVFWIRVGFEWIWVHPRITQLWIFVCRKNMPCRTLPPFRGTRIFELSDGPKTVLSMTSVHNLHTRSTSSSRFPNSSKLFNFMPPWSCCLLNCSTDNDHICLEIESLHPSRN